MDVQDQGTATLTHHRRDGNRNKNKGSEELHGRRSLVAENASGPTRPHPLHGHPILAQFRWPWVSSQPKYLSENY